jgi:hypothetical protein
MLLICLLLLGSSNVQAGDAPPVVQAGAVRRIIGLPGCEYSVVEQDLHVEVETGTRQFQVAGLQDPVSPLLLDIDLPGWRLDSLVFEQWQHPTAWQSDAASWLLAHLTRTPHGDPRLWVRANWALRLALDRSVGIMDRVSMDGEPSKVWADAREDSLVDAARVAQLEPPAVRAAGLGSDRRRIQSWRMDSLLHVGDVFPEQWLGVGSSRYGVRTWSPVDPALPVLSVHGKATRKGLAQGLVRYLARLDGSPLHLSRLDPENLLLSSITASPFFSVSSDTIRGIPWVCPVDSLLQADSPWQRTLHPVTCERGFLHTVPALPPPLGEGEYEWLAAPLDLLRNRAAQPHFEKNDKPASGIGLFELERAALGNMNDAEELAQALEPSGSTSRASGDPAVPGIPWLTVLPSTPETRLFAGGVSTTAPDFDPEASTEPLLQGRLVLNPVADADKTLADDVLRPPRMSLVMEPSNQAARYGSGEWSGEYFHGGRTALPLETILRRFPHFPSPPVDTCRVLADSEGVQWAPALSGYREYMAGRKRGDFYSGLADVEALSYVRRDVSAETASTVYRTIEIEIFSTRTDSVAFDWHERLEFRPWRIRSCSHPACLTAGGYAADIQVVLVPGGSTRIVLDVEGDTVLPLVAPVRPARSRRKSINLN